MVQLKKLILVALVALYVALVGAHTASAQDVHPIVDAGEGCLVGGVAGSKWLEADAIAPMLKGGERYRVYTLTKAAGRATGSNTESAGDPCNDTKSIKLSPEVKEGIAVGGEWNALPRIPKMLGTNNVAYRQAVTRILRGQGFVRPKIKITQVLRVDLDGDGAEEVIVSANNLAGGLSINGGPMAVHARPGDYTLVFLRKLVRGKVRDIILAEGYFPRKTSEQWTPVQNEVAAVLDLNGDGRMEIILHGGYYEGSWSTVFSLDEDRVTNLFGCGCGA